MKYFSHVPGAVLSASHCDRITTANPIRNDSPREPRSICLTTFERTYAFGTTDWARRMPSLGCYPCKLCLPALHPGDWPSELGEGVMETERQGGADCSQVACWDDLWGLGQPCVYESLQLSLVLASVAEQMGSPSKDILLASSPAWPCPIGQFQGWPRAARSELTQTHAWHSAPRSQEWQAEDRNPWVPIIPSPLIHSETFIEDQLYENQYSKLFNQWPYNLNGR